tara:strand:- start:174 stop:389 length:216 start_codon:yes stop_codon:yes gene_type:complete
MKIYRLKMMGDFGNEETKAVWFTRKADASKIAWELKDILGDDGFPDPALEEFNVSSKKSELVAFLNLYCDK